jgi:hypothetical protein
MVYALLISLKRSLWPGFLSGWKRSASLWYARLISLADAVVETPSVR